MIVNKLYHKCWPEYRNVLGVDANELFRKEE
nr:MAG TPA: hypothetical protein [Caudoviricetes sp.]